LHGYEPCISLAGTLGSERIATGEVSVRIAELIYGMFTNKVDGMLAEAV